MTKKLSRFQTKLMLSFMFIAILMGVSLFTGEKASAATLSVTAPSGTVYTGGNVTFQVDWTCTTPCDISYSVTGGTLTGGSSQVVSSAGGGAKNVTASGSSVTLTATLTPRNGVAPITKSATKSITPKSTTSTTNTSTSTTTTIKPSTPADVKVSKASSFKPSTIKVGEKVKFGCHYEVVGNTGSEAIFWYRYKNGSTTAENFGVVGRYETGKSGEAYAPEITVDSTYKSIRYVFKDASNAVDLAGWTTDSGTVTVTSSSSDQAVVSNTSVTGTATVTYANLINDNYNVGDSVKVEFKVSPSTSNCKDAVTVKLFDGSKELYSKTYSETTWNSNMTYAHTCTKAVEATWGNKLTLKVYSNSSNKEDTATITTSTVSTTNTTQTTQFSSTRNAKMMIEYLIEKGFFKASDLSYPDKENWSRVFSSEVTGLVAKSNHADLIKFKDSILSKPDAKWFYRDKTEEWINKVFASAYMDQLLLDANILPIGCTPYIPESRISSSTDIKKTEFVKGDYASVIRRDYHDIDDNYPRQTSIYTYEWRFTQAASVDPELGDVYNMQLPGGFQMRRASTPKEYKEGLADSKTNDMLDKANKTIPAETTATATTDNNVKQNDTSQNNTNNKETINSITGANVQLINNNDGTFKYQINYVDGFRGNATVNYAVVFQANQGSANFENDGSAYWIKGIAGSFKIGEIPVTTTSFTPPSGYEKMTIRFSLGWGTKTYYVPNLENTGYIKSNNEVNNNEVNTQVNYVDESKKGTDENVVKTKPEIESNGQTISADKTNVYFNYDAKLKVNSVYNSTNPYTSSSSTCKLSLSVSNYDATKYKCYYKLIYFSNGKEISADPSGKTGYSLYPNSKGSISKTIKINRSKNIWYRDDKVSFDGVKILFKVYRIGLPNNTLSCEERTKMINVKDLTNKGKTINLSYEDIY